MSKQLVESIVVDDADAVMETFNSVMAEKLADALEVRKVELASGIMDEAVVVRDKKGKLVGRYRNIETAKLLKPTSDGYEHSEDDGLSGNYSGKYPGGNKQKEKDKAAFMKRFAKEEVEQIDEETPHSQVNNLKAAGKHKKAGELAYKHGLGRKYGQHFGLRSTKDKDERAFHAGYDAAAANATNEEVEQIDEVGDTKVINKIRKNDTTRKIGYPTSKIGSGAASSRVYALQKGREILKKGRMGEEVEQVEEDMTDASKLSAMKSPNKAATLAALARYKKVGDINKLSAGHRTLVTGYLERTGGLGSLGNSVQRKVLTTQ